jgi:hypothetical protein
MIMKKTLYSILMMVGVLVAFTSCEKEDIGNTAAVETAGEWYVDIDAVDDSGNPIPGGSHYFGYDEERVTIITYNTSENVPTQMWIDDLGWFDLSWYYGNPAYPSYSFKCVVNVDPNNLTFSSVNAENLSGDFGITIEDGKILKDAGKQKNGSPADSIVFYVKYTNDPWYPDDGYAKYKISGIRYSGLAEND